MIEELFDNMYVKIRELKKGRVKYLILSVYYTK